MKKMTKNYPIVLIQCYGAYPCLLLAIDEGHILFSLISFSFSSLISTIILLHVFFPLFCSEIKCEKGKNKIEQNLFNQFPCFLAYQTHNITSFPFVFGKRKNNIY
jgi:hypothetical protein